MIDWLNLFFNSIWILALALALAVFSIAYYQAQKQGLKIRNLLTTNAYAFPLNIAGAMFCLSMALTSDRWWEIGVWIVLLGMFAYQGYKISKWNINS